MIFLESVKLLFSEAFTWKSRTRRAHYNYAMLFLTCIGVLIILIQDIYRTGILYELGFGLFFFIPFIGLIVRRMHDINVNAWALTVVFIPIIGELVLLSLMWAKPYSGENKWGHNPLDNPNETNPEQSLEPNSIWGEPNKHSEQLENEIDKETEKKLNKIEAMYKEKVISSSERKKMRNNVLNIN